MSKEKIAIASTMPSRKSTISDQAARCPYYHLFDQSGTLLEVIKNPYRDISGAAAQKSAQLLAEKDVKMIVAENFGKGMMYELEDKGIRYIRLSGDVDKALRHIVLKR